MSFQRLVSFAAGLLAFAAASLARAGNPAKISFPPASQTQGVGATVSFFVVASGDPTVLYQWSFDGAPIGGATSQLLTIPNVQTSNQGSYQVVVTNDFGSDTSAVVVLQVVLSPAVTGWSASSSVTEGSTASFSVFTTGQPPLTFQWDFDGAPIPGATNPTWTIPNAQSSNSGTYQVFVTNAYGNTSSPMLPLFVTLPPVVNGTTTSGPVAPGGTATFTAFLQGAAPLSCQWDFEWTNGTTNPVLNATNPVLIVTNVQASNEGSYQLFVTNVYGNTQTQPLPIQIIPGTPPVIGGQPSSLTVPQGFLAAFQVLASGTPPLYYQWSWNGNPIIPATNQVLSLPNVQPGNAGSYQVVVTNALGGQTSVVATLSLSSAPTQAPGVTSTPLLSFAAATTGSQPDASVIYASDGHLYVTTAQGGANDVNSGGDGTVSKLDTNGNVFWTVSMTQAGGANPAAGLVEGGGGLFYGTTVNGGAGFGTVFRITSGGALTPLYSFTNGVDGANPQAALTLGSDGFLYGCAAQGGTNDAGIGGDGTVFKMTTNGVMVWAVSLNGTDGRGPVAGLVQAANGVLYGTTTAGGANNLAGGGYGTVFSMTTNGVMTSLYTFTGGADGAYPDAGLAVGPDGGLYGTTTLGGNIALNSGLGFGSVFDITTNGSFLTLAVFDGTNGVSPQGTLTLGSDVNFYGVTLRGGVAFPTGYGTIFRVTMNGGLASLLSFNGISNGASPNAGLTQVNPLIFYGTTAQGGTNDPANGGDGSLFRFISPAGPPGLANIGNRVLQVGQELVFTNHAFGGTPPVTLSLAAGAATGAGLTTNGVFYWAPAVTQGSTTNRFTIWATDSSAPPLSNAMPFTVIVGPCVEVSIGSGPVQIGHSICVPVNFLTTVSLTNLNFSILTLPGRFANWQVNPVNGAIVLAAAQDPDTSQPQFNFAAQPGQVISGLSLLAYLCVDVLDSGDSAFAPLNVNSIAATTSAGAAVTPVFAQDGELVVIDGEPLVEATFAPLSAPAPRLTLYGNPGTNYFLQYTTALAPPIGWTVFTNITLTGLQTNFLPAVPADRLEFYRAGYVP